MKTKKNKQLQGNKPAKASGSPAHERIAACSQELVQLLDKHGLNLVAVPTYKPDGRGGWYTVCIVQLAPRGP